MRGLLGAGLGVIGLIALVTIERTGNARGRAFWKAFTSAGFVICALERGVSGRYDALVLAGLGFGLIGDVLLAVRGRNAFLAGMAGFAFGHALYAVAFASLSQEPFPRVSIALIGLIGCGVLAWLWPHLGRMRVPVAVYVAVIALMLVAVTGTLRLENPARWLIVGGAALFALSDVLVARERFVESVQINRTLGLPMYYAGQFLIAFSIGAF